MSAKKTQCLCQCQQKISVLSKLSEYGDHIEADSLLNSAAGMNSLSGLFKKYVHINQFRYNQQKQLQIFQEAMG